MAIAFHRGLGKEGEGRKRGRSFFLRNCVEIFQHGKKEGGGPEVATVNLSLLYPAEEASA